MTTNPILLKAGFLILGLHLTLASSAHAGGPALLDLPITGLNAKNGPQLVEQLSTRLEDKLGPHGQVSLAAAGRDGLVRIRLGWNRIVTLDDVDRALQGTEFRIDRNQLQFFGVVRLEVKGIKDLAALETALAPEADQKNLLTRPLKEGTTAITITDPRRDPGNLFTHRDLIRIVKEHGGQLTSINWGNTDAEGVTERENVSFHCRQPYGARLLSSATLPAR